MKNYDLLFPVSRQFHFIEVVMKAAFTLIPLLKELSWLLDWYAMSNTQLVNLDRPFVIAAIAYAEGTGFVNEVVGGIVRKPFYSPTLFTIYLHF